METIYREETIAGNCNDGAIGYFHSEQSHITVDCDPTKETHALMTIDGTVTPWSLTSSHRMRTTRNDESRAVSESVRECNGENVSHSNYHGGAMTLTPYQDGKRGLRDVDVSMFSPTSTSGLYSPLDVKRPCRRWDCYPLEDSLLLADVFLTEEDDSDNDDDDTPVEYECATVTNVHSNIDQSFAREENPDMYIAVEEPALEFQSMKDHSMQNSLLEATMFVSDIQFQRQSRSMDTGVSDDLSQGRKHPTGQVEHHPVPPLCNESNAKTASAPESMSFMVSETTLGALDMQPSPVAVSPAAVAAARPPVLPTLFITCINTKPLSRYQVFLVRLMQVFEATDDDIHTYVKGRNKSIQPRQVGFRCRHCAHLAVSDRPRGSTYFPSALLGIYQAAQNMSKNHVLVCTAMPEADRQRHALVVPTKPTSSKTGKKYWAECAAKLGLTDSGNGIFCVKTKTR